MKINVRKAALTLAALGIINAGAVMLNGCSSTKEKESISNSDMLLKPTLDDNADSETTVDTKDIVIVDTQNVNIKATNIAERYIVLLKTGMSIEDKTQYVEFRDINNFDFAGVFGIEKNDVGQTTCFTFVYGDITGKNNKKMAAFVGVDINEENWIMSLNDIIDPNYLKDTYSIPELKEIYNLLNEEYLNNNSNNDNVTAKLSYKISR